MESSLIKGPTNLWKWCFLVRLLQPQEGSHLLPPSCSSPLLSSPVEEHPHTEGAAADKINAHLLKKMAFR